MARYFVDYGGGESRKQAGRACDYMLVKLNGGGELYAERIYPKGTKADTPKFNALEAKYEKELIAEIIQQAVKYGISAEQLTF